MFIMLTIGLYIAKFLAVGAIGLFFLEDLELVKSVSPATYNTYALLAGGAFISLLFFALGKKLLWLIIFLVCGGLYATMYNGTEEIRAIHEKNDIQSRYFKDTATFSARMLETLQYFNQKTK